MAEEPLEPFTAEELAHINQAITEHSGGYKPCWSCGTVSWSVFPGIVTLLLQPRAGSLRKTPASTSNLMLLCTKCGHTVLLNVFVLGLGKFFGLKSASEEQREQKAAEEAAARST